MPLETGKEVAKIAVETSGEFVGVWRWIVGAAGTGLLWLGGRLHGRLTRLEESAVFVSTLKAHTEEEEKKFDALFKLLHENTETTTRIRESVARIEGKLNGNYERRAPLD